MEKSKQSRGSDKRYIPRWEVRNKILYRKENSSTYHQAASKNINSNGVCFYCTDEMTPHQKIDLVLYLSDSLAVEVSGKILWNSVEDNSKLIGVRFEEASTQVKELILQYAFEYRKDDVLKHWFAGWNAKTTKEL